MERRATFTGQYFSIENAVCYPKPIQMPHPTIMIGGSGEKYLLRVVAKHANRYNSPFCSPKQFGRKSSILEDHCRIIGRDFKEIEKSVILKCLIRETENDLDENIKKWKRKEETIEQFKQRLDCNTIIGTPEQVISKLKEYTDLGATHIILHFIALNEQCLKLFNSKVIKKI
jgi:alkanesulfonate monooxygenase SsuD/methylene tetrahydromethanopterin reductase-like flavin-dependent oxidoreductase (luciferase family)